MTRVGLLAHCAVAHVGIVTAASVVYVEQKGTAVLMRLRIARRQLSAAQSRFSSARLSSGAGVGAGVARADEMRKEKNETAKRCILKFGGDVPK